MDPCTFQLIDGDRPFQVDSLNSFAVKTKFSDHGNFYRVVSFWGISGRSNLLNRLFGTDFKVKGTQGIWMAKCHDFQPFTIVMNMEATGGSVKKGDTTFNDRSALFALEISDVVMITTLWKDHGRLNDGDKDLLKTLFKFMVQLFKPRKTTLLFVLRCYEKAEFKKLKQSLKGDIEKIWKKVPKPDAHEKTPLSEFFKVEIVAFYSGHNEKEFQPEVDKLRQRFSSSASTSQGGQVAADRQIVSAWDFSNHAHNIWKLITISSVQVNQVMVSATRCDEIIKHELDALSSAQLDDAIKAGPREFAGKLRSILKTCLSNYDEETKYYDEVTRTAKREVLEVKALERLRPAYDGMLKNLFVKALTSFSTDLVETLKNGIDEEKDFAASVDTLEQSCVRKFEKGCEALGRANWDASPNKETLIRTMKTLASRVKNLAKSQENSPELVLAALSAIGQTAELVSALTSGGTRNIM